MQRDDPWTRHQRFNAGSRDQWEGFASHREKVSSLLASAGDPTVSRLCILGAGNTNDLDLPRLLEAYREVHLVDLDGEAMRLGAERQGLGGHPQLHLHGKVELTAMLDGFARWSPSCTVSPAELDALVEWPATRVARTLPGPFDVVATTCLLSQIVGNAFVHLGDHHAQLDHAVAAIRLGHLRLLAELARPGGRVAFISDVVNSEHVPAVLTTPESALPELLRNLAERGGTIRGMNPSKLLVLFRRDPVLAAKVAGVEIVPPWCWKLYRRHYLVWAAWWKMRETGQNIKLF